VAPLEVGLNVMASSPSNGQAGWPGQTDHLAQLTGGPGTSTLTYWISGISRASRARKAALSVTPLTARPGS